MIQAKLNGTRHLLFLVTIIDMTAYVCRIEHERPACGDGCPRKHSVCRGKLARCRGSSDYTAFNVGYMMSQSSHPETAADKLDMWCKKVVAGINDLIKSKESPRALTERYFRFYQEDMEPVLHILLGDPRYETATRHLNRLRDALDGLFLSPPDDQEERKKILSTVYRAAIALQKELRPQEADQAFAETKLRDLAWRTRMDDEGYIVFDAGGGIVVPLSGDIRQLARPGIIAQAIRQQPACPEDMRPRNVRNQPGSLLTLNNAKRLLVIGDLHGRYDNLQLALGDKDNWRALKNGSAHLIFLGDAIHPRAVDGDQDAANADSFRTMFLIMSLRAENPGNVHYLLGNHENSHVGGFGAGKGGIDVQKSFAAFIQHDVSPIVLDVYEKFLRTSPIAAKVKVRNGHILLVHASPSSLVLNEQGLINLTFKGRRGKALTDMVWSRNFNPNPLRTILRNVGASLAICGHTRPTMESEKRYGYRCILDRVFGDVHGLMLIVNSQSNIFGYLDIDLTRPIPKRIEDMKAPDGNSALRALRRTGSHTLDGNLRGRILSKRK